MRAQLREHLEGVTISFHLPDGKLFSRIPQPASLRVARQLALKVLREWPSLELGGVAILWDADGLPEESVSLPQPEGAAL